MSLSENPRDFTVSLLENRSISKQRHPGAHIFHMSLNPAFANVDDYRKRRNDFGRVTTTVMPERRIDRHC
jgi:hypothetical protein